MGGVRVLADLHTHSCFSFDGAPEATLEALCEAAISKGLSHLAVTDHCDINGEIEGIYAVLDKDAVFDAVSKAKKVYADRLTLLFGVELGQAYQYPAQSRALLDRYPYDIVLGSLHNLRGEQDFYYMDYSTLTDAQIADLFDRSLDESMELLDFDGIHVLTHLTYMHRYVRRGGKDIDFAPFHEKLTTLLEKVIQKGVALELNTSALTKERGGVFSPTKEILSLYRSLGGKLISIGSDAHTPQNIAQHFDAAKQALLDCGFTELAVPTREKLLTFPIS
jgi:histidinol-phosphatase (PHP family)